MVRGMTASEPVYTRAEVEGERGVAAAGHPAEAEAAIEMLAAGGNAIDGLIAAAFVGFVVEPASCGVGGYAHTSVWHAGLRRLLTFDAYVRAPAKARPDMYAIDRGAAFHYYGHPATEGREAERGFLSPAVPGAVRGLADVHAACGRLPWRRLLEPAIRAAEAGVPFTWQLKLTIADHEAEIRELPDTAAILLPGGNPPRTPYNTPDGDRLDTTALAATLKRIATRGADGFHRGPVAEAIGSYVTRNGGILSADDLAGFRTRIVAERPARYRGHDYVACFDQVAYEALNILEGYDLARHGPDSFAYRHLAAEALALAFVDSIAHYGDPDVAKAPVSGLASPAFAAARRGLIRMGRAIPRPVAAGDPWPFDDPAWRPSVWPASTTARREGTSQMAVADAEGNTAATIVSLSGGFGSLVYVPEVGVFLNNSMQNFDPRPEHPNAIAPGKMPVFAAPAVVAVKGDRPRFAGAGSGGYRIETGVLHAMMNVIDHCMGIQAALDHPRVHCQGRETYVDRRIPEAVRRRLSSVGHEVVVVEENPGTNNFGRVVALTVDRGGRMAAGAYPPWATGAAAL
jgi:gamma-glutamyltranspeptidase/glutathione hydrolase